MVSLRGTLANLGLRYEIDLVKQQGGPMPELSSSGQRLNKKERNNQIERRLVAAQVQARLETFCRCGYVPQNWHEGSKGGTIHNPQECATACTTSMQCCDGRTSHHVTWSETQYTQYVGRQCKVTTRELYPKLGCIKST